MSRSFLPDQELIDRLMADDTEAFEELYRRYWYSLYHYSFQKLHASDNARRIVRNVFVRLWEMRKTFPVDFILSEFLYTEVRRAVVIHLSNQLNLKDEESQAALLLQFSAQSLREAARPVQAGTKLKTRPIGSYPRQPRLFVTLSHLKWLFESASAKLF
jgi:DNA-directed RNA polymerase specialized sigma24 family protein